MAVVTVWVIDVVVWLVWVTAVVVVPVVVPVVVLVDGESVGLIVGNLVGADGGDVDGDVEGESDVVVVGVVVPVLVPVVVLVDGESVGVTGGSSVLLSTQRSPDSMALAVEHCRPSPQGVPSAAKTPLETVHVPAPLSEQYGRQWDVNPVQNCSVGDLQSSSPNGWWHTPP